MATEKFANLAASVLNGSINSADTSLTVAAAASFPSAGNFRILVDVEIMLVTGVAGNVFTVTRGVEGTSATSHSNGAALTHVLTAASLPQLLADSTLTKLSETVLTGTQSSITFSSISQLYRNLQLSVMARSNVAATKEDCYIQYNGDVAANYSTVSLSSDGTAVSTTGTYASATPTALKIPSASATSGLVCVADIIIFAYSATTFKKHARINQWGPWTLSAGNLTLGQVGHIWASTAAISSITLAMASGSFLAGSTFTLYGVP